MQDKNFKKKKVEKILSMFKFPLCGIVVRVSGYRCRGLGLIPGATRFSEK
jgi:hypothetical protein